nr:right-handed parallel beta-helix repeat-containing protein [Bacteroidota bacterium]
IKDANDSVSVMIKVDYVKVCPPNYIAGGNVSGTWTAANSPYFISGEIVVPYGETLSIEPGVSIKFRTNTEDVWYMMEEPTPYNTDFGYMTVYGTLIAQGTVTDSITFTRQGNMGSWGLIHMTENANPAYPFEYCKIDYTSYMLSDTINGKQVAGLCFDGIDATVRNSRFYFNYDGIKCDSSNAIISYNSFYQNFTAVEFSSGSSPQISHNHFSGGFHWAISGGEGCESFIDHNLIENFDAGIHLRYGNGSSITNNTIRNCGNGIETDRAPAIIDKNIISGNTIGIVAGGGFSYLMISNDTITENGTGIYLIDSKSEISGNLIRENTEYGIQCRSDTSSITGNTISGNGINGIDCYHIKSSVISGNTISDNHQNGIYCYWESNPQIDHNIISSNNQNGICCVNNSIPVVAYNTIADNSYGLSYDGGSALAIENSILWGNTSGVVAPGSLVTITWSCIEGGYAGDGNIDLDPMFTGTKDGDYELTWTNFPDKSDSTRMSPCIDSSNPDMNSNGSDWMLDPDDRDPDMSRLDMGGRYFHQLPLVTVYNDPDTTSGECKFFNFGEWQIPEISTPKTFYIRNDADRFNDCPVFFEGSGGSQYHLVNQEDTLLYLEPYELDSVVVVFQPSAVGSQNAYFTASDTAQYTDSLWVRGTGLGTGTVIGFVRTPTGEGVQGVTITVEALSKSPDGGNETKNQGKGGNNTQGPTESFTTTTMPDGSFAVTNVGYGNFSVTPELIQNGIVHDFNPVSSNVYLASPTPVSTNFTDVSYFIVSGNVSFMNTTCPSGGRQILLDNVPAAITDEFGDYTIDDVQIGSHIFKPDTAGGHHFMPSFVLDTIMYPVAGLNFEDKFTYNLSGHVTGGCGIPLADSVELIVECLNVCGITDTIYTDSLGFYSINLAPYQYYVTPATINYFGNLITFDTEQVDVSQRDTIQDFIYHSEPIIEITGFDSVTNQNGWIILEQFEAYEIEIDVFEPYGEFGEIMCRVDTGNILILDDLSDAGQVDVPISDTTLYSFYAGFPNIAGGGEHAYQKRLQIQYVYDAKSVATNEEWVYITGQRPRETAFTTTTPEIPMLILRDPPGDGSYSYLSETTEVSQAISFGVEYSDNVGHFEKASLGLKFESSVGFGFAVTTNVNVTMDFTTGMNISMSQNSITENQMTFVTSETFSTSSDEYVVGRQADLYMGGAMNLLYGITDILSIEDTVITVDQDIIIVPDGFATTYIYSEYYIVNTVIPALYLIQDTTSAHRWESFIDLNQRLKNEAEFYQNISFDAGVSYSYFEMMSQSSSYTQKVDLTITEEVAMNAGLNINGIGASGGFKISTTMTTGSSHTNSSANSTKIGFNLGDNDPGDAFTVDIKTDPVYGTPVFQTISGQTKCPYEENSVPRQGCQLNPHTFVANNVSPDEPAVFYLYMNNTSQTDETWVYGLGVLNETNPHGATIKAGGKSLATPIEENLLANVMTPIAIQIYRPPGEVYDLVGLTLRLASPCEVGIAGVLGVDPNLADYATFDVHFTPPCSPVSILSPNNNWIVNQANNNILQVTITDYELTNTQLQAVSLEYSPDFGSNWIEVYSIPKDSIQTSFLVAEWDVTYLMDDFYLLRAVAECAGGVENHSEILTGIIDRSSPQVSGNPQPSDGVLNPGDEISFTFSEDLDPSSVTINTCQLLNAENGMQIGASVQYSQAYNKVIFTVNAGYNYFIENRYLKSQIFGVTDDYGNPIEDTASWTFLVDQGPLHWNPNSFSFTIDAGDTLNFSSTLDNASSTQLYYSVLVPDWLSATPYSGYLSAAGGYVDVDFTSELMQGGVYYDTIYSNTLGYPEEEIYIMVEAEGGPELAVSPANQGVSATSGTTGFNITSNNYWTVSESVDWLSVQPMNGSGNGTLTVSYDENILITSRLGEIIISTDGAPDVTVTVTQTGVDPELTLTPDNQNVTSLSGTTSFDISSNTSWTVSESVDWLTVDHTNGTGNGTLTVNYDLNNTITQRIGSITVSIEDKMDVIVTVTQAGAEPGLAVNPDNQNVTSSSGSISFDITSNTSWTVNESVDWLTVDPTTGSGNGTLTVNYDENTSITQRIGSITLSASDVPDVIVTVTQAGAEPELTVNPDNQNVSSLSGTTSFDVTSNTSWTVSKSVDWLTVDPTTGSGNGTLNVNYDENTSITQRVGSITISAPDVPDVIVTITQAGADPELSVSPDNQDVSSLSGTTSFNVSSNTNWTVIESVDWLTVDPTTGTGNGTLSVYYDENTTITQRVGNITVLAPDVPDVIFTVTQAGAGPELEVNPANQDVSASAGMTSFDVISNTSWIVSEIVDWFNVDPMSGIENGMITVTYNQNTSGSTRIGEITITANGGTPQVLVTVTQESYALHTINIQVGWSGLSSYIMPTDPEIENIFASILDELVIVITEEDIFYPLYNINTIVNWEQHSAYKVKTNGGVSLNFTGVVEENKTVMIDNGWNLIPVVSECPVDVESVFAPVVSDLVIVKEVAGWGIYWPTMGINSLWTMNPGEAYYVLMTDDIPITFGDCVKGAVVTAAFVFPPNPVWNKVVNTPVSHVIGIMETSIVNFETGDYIGVFTHEGICAGQIIIDALQKQTAFVAFGSDHYETDKMGFNSGEAFNFKLYKSSTGEEYNLIPEFDLSRASGGGLFMENGISMVTGFIISGTEKPIDFVRNITLIPNPTTGRFTITGIDEGAEVDIFDLQGQLIKSEFSRTNQGVEVNLTGRQSGIYIVRIFSHGEYIYRKLILK